MNDDELFDDETTITEITIGPDGRVFTFGTSRAVVEILHGLAPADEKVLAILKQLGNGLSVPDDAPAHGLPLKPDPADPDSGVASVAISDVSSRSHPDPQGPA